MEALIDLGLALAVGLLIGTERGWQARAAAEGSRVAGIRTFGLIGLLGGLWALLAERIGVILLGFAFVAFAALIIISHIQDVRADKDVGITTVVAALVAFCLGAMVPLGFETVASAGAVLTAILLSLKPVLHSWLRSLEALELNAALKLLLISVVLLPVLPDRGYGPWQALNPYEMWWMVVLIAGISFAGYFAMKVAGTGRGILLTSLLGGIVSSTATTLNFARLGRSGKLQRVLAAGVILAVATMFPRILIEVAVVNRQLLPLVLAPVALMAASAVLAAVWFWRSQLRNVGNHELPLSNPFQLFAAIQFGSLLGVIMLLAAALRHWFGETGIYALALVSGLADVDAITLSLARLAQTDLAALTAAQAIVLAAIMNTLVKGFIVGIVAGRRMLFYVLPSCVLIGAVGALGLLLV